MKKIIFLSAILMLSALVSCENVGKSRTENSSAVSSSTSEVSETEEQASETDTAAAEETTVQTDNSSDSTGTTAAKTTEFSSATTSAATTETKSAEFNYDDNGAVVVKSPAAEVDDDTLISIANALYDSACKTQWEFTVGSPYRLDTENYIENDYGWQLYLITDPNINSLKDVEDDYHKVFSDRYPDNDIKEIYAEKDGHAYALNGARGANIFYSYSLVTKVDSKKDDEIFFTVTNYYDGTDIDGSAAYSKDETFSVVIESDGTWKVGQFRLPM